MSTYYYASIFKKDVSWKYVDTVAMNRVKNITSGWCLDCDSVSVEDELVKKAREENSYYSYKFLGIIKKEELNKLNKEAYSFDEMAPSSNPLDYKPVVFLDKKETETLVYENNIDIFSASRNDDCYNVFLKVKYCYEGYFYDYNSFDDIIKKSKKELKRIKKNKKKWEELSNSLEYLKLSIEEKENVMENLDIEDYDHYYGYRLYTAEMLKGVLDFFREEDNEVYLYIYNDNSAVEVNGD